MRTGKGGNCFARIGVLLAVLLTLTAIPAALTGCAGDPSEKSPGPDAEKTPPSSATEAPVLGSFSERDLDAVILGHTIRVGENESALDVLGPPEYVEQADSCLFDGYDKTYHYSFGDIFTFPSKDAGGNVIDEIYITGEGCTLKGGVAIGSTRADVEAAFGRAYYTDGDSMIVYNTENDSSKNEVLPKLYFVFEQDVTVGIGFCANLYHPEG